MERSATPKVSVAILNHNGRAWLGPCLESVLRTVYPSLEVVVVDNASRDGSQELVGTAYPQVRLFALSKNVGFAGAYNEYLRQYRGRYVVFLNNDTIVTRPEWISRLVRVMEDHPSVAAATCKLMYLRHPRTVNSLGGAAFWWTGSFDLGNGDPEPARFDAEFLEPFAFCGGAAIVRCDAVREVGGFDDLLFAYREDFDLSWRLRLQGYRILCVPDVTVLHAGGATWGTASYAKLYLSSRNWLRLMLKNYSMRTLVRAIPAFLIFELTVRLAGGVWVSRDPRFALIPLHSLLWNIVHLADTLAARRRIQRERRVSDEVIRHAMGSGGIEPMAHLLHRARTARGQQASSRLLISS